MKGKKTEAAATGSDSQKTAKKIPFEVASGTNIAASSKTTTPDSAISMPKDKEGKKGTEIKK